MTFSMIDEMDERKGDVGCILFRVSGEYNKDALNFTSFRYWVSFSTVAKEKHICIELINLALNPYHKTIHYPVVF